MLRPISNDAGPVNFVVPRISGIARQIYFYSNSSVQVVSNFDVRVVHLNRPKDAIRHCDNTQARKSS
jgi:hypothetical protein